MFSRSLLLVLLVLACLQSFTTAYSANEPGQCCVRFQTRPIPVRIITAYKESDLRCLKPGVIFTLHNGRELCADPGFNWVKNHIDTINQLLFNSQTQTEKPDKAVSTPSPSRNEPDKPVSTATPTEKDAVGPDQCCVRFQTRPISVRFITAYKVTGLRFAKPGVIFTLQSGHELCADPGSNWVKKLMRRINQLLFNSQTQTENPNIPDQCCLKFQTRPIPVRNITAYKVTDLRCPKPGVIFTLQSGRELCADPGSNWVKNHMDKINQLLFKSVNNPTESD